jgi:hypothetical protein
MADATYKYPEKVYFVHWNGKGRLRKDISKRKSCTSARNVPRLDAIRREATLGELPYTIGTGDIKSRLKDRISSKTQLTQRDCLTKLTDAARWA